MRKQQRAKKNNAGRRANNGLKRNRSATQSQDYNHPHSTESKSKESIAFRNRPITHRGSREAASRETKPKIFEREKNNSFPHSVGDRYARSNRPDFREAKPKTFERAKSNTLPRNNSTGTGSSFKPNRKESNTATRNPYASKPSFRNREAERNSPKNSRASLKEKEYVPSNAPIRLNRYIANSGVCSRRKADELILAGEVQVNGATVTEMGCKVQKTDQIRFNGQLLKQEKKVYVLLNKPKDYITTTDDPNERKTVMALVENASRERICPVGRLDRNTTGLLLFTNDGDLADKLTHPKNNIAKLYKVTLDKNCKQEDFYKISAGLQLEDGFIKPDSLSFVEGGTKSEVGIQMHSGKNRIVRRIFEHLGYEVIKLDRIIYADLNKKDLPRGRWRYLTETELLYLKRKAK